tara:strand:- start:468 stop:1025 length:558 start_codon:yes stop_codon:yes gene_type:complete
MLGYEMLKRLLPISAFFSFIAALAVGLFLENKDLPSVLVGKQVPSFSLKTIDGSLVTNNDLPGEIFLLNVWGSYCLPCLIEHPTFMSLTERGEIPVVGINYRDELNLADDWLKENGDPFLFSIADPSGRFGIDLGVYGAPETYLVDAEGIIRYRHVSVLNDSVWREVFLPLVKSLRTPKIALVGM